MTRPINILAAFEYSSTCEHGACSREATYAVWTSHHALECRDAMGLRCAKHAAELKVHWMRGLGGELLCGCVVEGTLNDHYRAMKI